MITQSSNEHLDQLNARAQAIRIQAGELGDEGLPVSGRPYELRENDQVQVRRTLRGDGERPALRNGTGAEITSVDSDQGRVELRLESGDTVELDRQDVEDADVRLAYVQHPFPAQGQTVDTAHLIVGDHSTQEGSYVALTRARQRTDLYAAEPVEVQPGQDHLQQLAERLSRTEPEIPSIAIPLAHEDRTENATSIERELATPTPTRRDDQDTPWSLELGDELGPPILDSESIHEEIAPADPDGPRRWPASADRDTNPRSVERQLEPKPEPGWEM